MKYILAILFFSSCVTSGDLRAIGASLAELEATVGDPKSTPESLREAISKTREEVAEVATRVEERTEGALETIDEVSAGGIIPAILSAVVLHVIRNRREKKVWGEPEKKPV